ncbi:hypothetical protein D1007_00955 [Hordeum vulgare]|nr:hypothetical protein D1007_00955 [Hordeum vulgare]
MVPTNDGMTNSITNLLASHPCTAPVVYARLCSPRQANFGFLFSQTRIKVLVICVRRRKRPRGYKPKKISGDTTSRKKLPFIFSLPILTGYIHLLHTSEMETKISATMLASQIEKQEKL